MAVGLSIAPPPVLNYFILPAAHALREQERFDAQAGEAAVDLVPLARLARVEPREASEWNEVDGGFSGLGIKSFLFPKGVSGG